MGESRNNIEIDSGFTNRPTISGIAQEIREVLLGLSLSARD
jgi:hypothetical protein